MVKRGYTTADAIANDVIQDIGLVGRVDDVSIKRWVHTCVEDMLGTEQLTFSIALLHVRNHEAELPPDLRSISLVAAIQDMSKCWNREHFVGYTEKVYGTDCEVEVKLKCSQCGEKACSCSTPIMDIQVDDLYMRERPYLWAMTSAHYLGYSAATTDGFACPNFSPDYKIMVPRKADDAYWNSEYYLGVCAAIKGKVDQYTFEIEPPKFITDMKEGQVYMAYLRHRKDEEGYWLVPNYPVVVEAVQAFVVEKMMKRAWMRDGNQSDRLRWLDAKNMADSLRAQARSELEMPTSEKWNQLLHKHVILGADRFYY